jgi:hypothetical protein
MVTLKIPLHGNGVVTREAIIKNKRPVVAKFARGITEAIYYIKAEKEATKAIIRKYTGLAIPKAPIKPITTTPLYCWMCLMPIPPASSPCSTICQRKTPRPLPPTQKLLSIRASFRRWRHRDSSNSCRRNKG